MRLCAAHEGGERSGQLEAAELLGEELGPGGGSGRRVHDDECDVA